MDLSAFRQLARQDGARGLAVASITARLPNSMWGVVLFLAVQQHLGSGDAAMLTSAYTLGLAATAPVRGRWVDRKGPRFVLPATAILYAALVIALVGLLRQLPVGGLAVFAFAVGAANPPVVQTVRGLWTRVTPEGPLRQTAMAFDAVMIEVAFIAGPALAGVLTTLVSPAAAAGVVLAAVGLSVWQVLHVLPAQAGRAPARRSLLGPLASGSFRTVVGVTVIPSAALAGVEIILLTLSRADGFAWAGGGFLALMAVGSLVGGILYGSIKDGRSDADRLPVLLALMAASMAPLIVGGASPWLLLVSAPIAGATSSPALGVVFSLAASRAPAEMATEAQSWVNTALTAGASLGVALVAPFTQHISLAVLVLMALVVVGALWTLFANQSRRVATAEGEPSVTGADTQPAMTGAADPPVPST